MSELSVSIDYEAFAAAGLDVSFNSERYLDLLHLAAEGAEISTYPSVAVVPRYDLGLTWKQRLDVDRRDLDALKENGQDGHYLPGTDEVLIRIRHSVDRTNNTLRHETKHWADDNAGILVPEMWRAIEKEKSRSSRISDMSALGAILAQKRYRQLPYERRARDFAANKGVKKLIGNIITY